MRYVLTFLICAALAVASIIVWLAAILPRGEGAFGIAKVVPLILVFGSAVAFCVIWFPANLGVFLWHRRTHRDEPSTGESKAVVFLSGCVFVLCISTVGAKWISAWHYSHSPQAYALPAPQRQVELQDVKGLIDDFCKRERNGQRLTPEDGIFGTMQQIISLSTPDVITYTADNLQDDSGFLWAIAASPNCPTNLFTRFLAVPSTHESLARNRNAPPQVLESLSHSESSVVRARVAANAGTPAATLERLVSDPDGIVRDSAATNLKRHIQ
jgi:hypothetical protein